MKELIRTTDPVLISWVKSLLKDGHIESFELDTHMSVLEGSIGILPRRLMVIDDEYDQACRILKEAGHDPYDGK